MHTNLITYGWPDGAKAHEIEFWDAIRGVSTEVATNYKRSDLTYPTSESTPGLLLVYPVRSTTGVGATGRGKPYVFSVNDAPYLATFRQMVRAAVNDTQVEDGIDVQYVETPKWPDNEIDTYVREAIGLLNQYQPAEYVITVPINQLSPDLFAGVEDVTGVSVTDETSREWIDLPRHARKGNNGYRYATTSRRVTPRYWDYLQGHLRLYGFFSASTQLEITIERPYRIPLNDLSPIDLEKDDWDIVSIYSQAKCYLRLAGQSAQLDRWKEEGKRNDNPITPIGRLLMDDAMSRLKNRKRPHGIRRQRS